MNSQSLSHSQDEQRLIALAAQGNLEAFNQLVLMHQSMAYNHALALIGDPHHAEDAVQESFIKAFQAMQSFRGGSLRSWLLRIVTNSIYDVMRQSRRHPTQSLFPTDDEGEEIEAPAWLVDLNSSVQAAVELNELSRHIYDALDELPDVYRSVLTLIDLHELDYIEAAQALKVPIGTVKSRLARARLQMRQKLEARVNFLKHGAEYAGICA